MFQQTRRRLFSLSRHHAPQNTANGKKPLCRSADIVQARIIQQNLLDYKSSNLSKRTTFRILIPSTPTLGKRDKPLKTSIGISTGKNCVFWMISCDISKKYFSSAMDQNMISCFVQSIKHNESVSVETRNRNPAQVHRKKKIKTRNNKPKI